MTVPQSGHLLPPAMEGNETEYLSTLVSLMQGGRAVLLQEVDEVSLGFVPDRFVTYHPLDLSRVLPISPKASFAASDRKYSRIVKQLQSFSDPWDITVSSPWAPRAVSLLTTTHTPMNTQQGQGAHTAFGSQPRSCSATLRRLGLGFSK